MSLSLAGVEPHHPLSREAHGDAMAKAVTIWPDVLGSRISPYLHGQFAEHLGKCVYGGIWVGESSSVPNEDGLRIDALEALRALELPVLRWPGGCFADNYNWRDGVGPREDRPRRHNIWWKQPESNHFGTEEFMRLCRLVGTEPYLAVNVGSGSVREAADWVEYCNSSQNTTLAAQRAANGSPKPHGVRYWGIGNENWICGGNMTPEHYANLYRQTATYIRQMEGDRACLIACGSNGWDIYNPEWDERVLSGMKNALHLIDHLAVHIYFANKMPAEDYTTQQYGELLDSVEAADRYLEGVIGLVTSYQRYGRQIGIILDEWGTWYTNAVVDNGLSQESTQADAVFTALSLHCFQRRGERFFMANMAQTANVLQSLYHTRGSQLYLTPTYHVFDLFKAHRGGRLVHVDTSVLPAVEFPDGRKRQPLSVLATCHDDSSECYLTVVNSDPENSHEMVLCSPARDLAIVEARRLGSASLYSKNSFESPDVVAIEDITGAISPGRMTFPPHSITAVRLAPVARPAMLSH